MEPCKQESVIENLKARVEAFEKYITEGTKYRVAILGIVFAIILQIGGFFYFWGGMNTKVCRNESDIQRTLNKLDKLADAIHDGR